MAEGKGYHKLVSAHRFPKLGSRTKWFISIWSESRGEIRIYGSMQVDSGQTAGDRRSESTCTEIAGEGDDVELIRGGSGVPILACFSWQTKWGLG